METAALCPSKWRRFILREQKSLKYSACTKRWDCDIPGVCPLWSSRNFSGTRRRHQAVRRKGLQPISKGGLLKKGEGHSSSKGDCSNMDKSDASAAPLPVQAVNSTVQGAWGKWNNQITKHHQNPKPALLSVGLCSHQGTGIRGWLSQLHQDQGLFMGALWARELHIT